MMWFNLIIFLKDRVSGMLMSYGTTVEAESFEAAAHNVILAHSDSEMKVVRVDLSSIESFI